MRKLLTLLSLYIVFSTLLISGCGGSKEAQDGDGLDSLAQASALDSLAMLADSLRGDSLGSSVAIGELDSVTITTDTRIDPVAAFRSGNLSAKAVGAELIEEKGLGCKYYLPKTWQTSRRDYKNLVNYFYDGRISVTISVANSVFDSLSFWAQVQEAITYGKNQIPKLHWRFDPPVEQNAAAAQTYLGRYEFGGKQYNTAYYFHGKYQFHIIVSHKVDALTDSDAQVINYLMASFVAEEPTVEIPKPVTISDSQEETPEEKPNTTPEPKAKPKAKVKKSK
ncbi:hypothetical protein Ctha_0746 [Chloroherpeton thalassium ATCC 35110]|uniref:Lipoprotein n=1 Tax=Chloroherpeton thalassium (strain ATCC 35110 / GB-78) TaxID=517418 RepID=B3QWA2_CHLT3|nr:hypothetical protein [Chloroherpeton thalassium]ACF13215.1 hypothetical protein Ctha_0746 [Chloroherpeton thalassium ATCC 35110]